MAENKKIKKLQKVNRNSTIRFKKAFLRPQRAQTGTMHKPMKFCDEKDVYMMESDIVFGLKDNEISFDVSMLGIFKHITSVEVRKDLPEKIVTFRLEPHSHPPSTTCQQVAENLEENETSAIKEWAGSVQKFGLQHDNFIKGFEKFVKETPLDKKLRMREESAYKRLGIFTKYPSFEMRYRMKNNQIKCSELVFNETFIQETGYIIDNFTATVLSDGLPQLFPPDCPAILDTIKGFMQNLNYENAEVKLPEQETDLFMKTGQRKRVMFEPVMLMELTEIDLIISLIFIVKMKSEPFGSYQKLPYSAEFLAARRDTNKEKEYLFGTYYRGKIQATRSYTDKICKIKELA